MRIAYLTGEYPRATDTFIQREVFTFRKQGVDVETFSIRRTGDEHIVGVEQAAERDRTFYIFARQTDRSADCPFQPADCLSRALPKCN